MITEYTIYACTQPGCDYYRDRMSTGIHAVRVRDKTVAGGWRDATHPIAPLVVVPKLSSHNSIQESE